MTKPPSQTSDEAYTLSVLREAIGRATARHHNIAIPERDPAIPDADLSLTFELWTAELLALLPRDRVDNILAGLGIYAAAGHAEQG